MPVHPRPSDLVALVACLPPAAIVLTFDVETCADPAGGDARVAGRARVVQLGIAAFSGEPLPGCGDPVHLPPGATTHEPAPAPLRYVHRSDASDADLLARAAIPTPERIQQVGELLRKYDVNAYAASVKVFAVK